MKHHRLFVQLVLFLIWVYSGIVWDYFRNYISENFWFHDNFVRLWKNYKNWLKYLIFLWDTNRIRMKIFWWNFLHSVGKLYVYQKIKLRLMYLKLFWCNFGLCIVSFQNETLKDCFLHIFRHLSPIWQKLMESNAVFFKRTLR